MNRLWLDFDRELPWSPRRAPTPRPHLNVTDAGAAVVIRVEVPGIAEKDLDVSIHGQSLTLKGERKEDAPEGYSVHRRERGGLRFARAVDLPFKVDAEKATAALANGVLTLTVPKASEAQPKRIAVSST